MSPAARSPQTLLRPRPSDIDEENKARESHAWVVEIVTKRFKDGLSKVLDGVFVASRFSQFVARADPVYVTLLQGMADEGAARVLVGDWMVAHTLATQSRFWLEDAIIDILLERAKKWPEPRPAVYSLHMLADGWHASGRSLWDVGERWREEVHGRGVWRPLIQEKALQTIELIVGEEDRQFESIEPGARKAQLGSGAITPRADARSLQRAADALGGPPRHVAVRCNLLIIEPERADLAPHTWALRYINPTTFNQAATIRSERANLLRLRAYLAQEKPFRAPRKIRVAIADLVPRTNREEASGRVAAHFSALTHWSASQFWGFLDVPFPAVTAGIRDAGVSMRAQLGMELRQLLETGEVGGQ